MGQINGLDRILHNDPLRGEGKEDDSWHHL